MLESTGFNFNESFFMLPLRIIPRYRLLLQYDIRPEFYDTYYEYVIKEFVPALQSMGLYMVAVWHTAFGDYPVRQVEFIGESLEAVSEVLHSDRWQTLESRLTSYTQRYRRKLVRYRAGFQF
ncbi:MAG: hypothetical protein DWB42_11295 [Chloroflexi bacterium]|nr:hypothetical protein [Chloroflexota bacterium]